MSTQSRLGPFLPATLLAGVLLAACGGGASPVPSAEPAASPTPVAAASATPAPPEATPAPTAPAAGADAIVLADAGFRMPLADGWRLLPLEGGAEAVLALLPAGSQLEGVLANGLDPLLQAGLVAWAIDGAAPPNDITANVNVIVRVIPELPEGDALREALVAELQAVPGILDVSAGAAEVGGRPAILASYTGEVTGASTTATGLQYTIPVDGGLLIVTFTVPTGDAAARAAVDTMIRGATIAP